MRVRRPEHSPPRRQLARRFGARWGARRGADARPSSHIVSAPSSSSRPAGMWMPTRPGLADQSLRGITPRRLTLQTGLAPWQSKYRREFLSAQYCWRDEAIAIYWGSIHSAHVSAHQGVLSLDNLLIELVGAAGFQTCGPCSQSAFKRALPEASIADTVLGVARKHL